MAVVRVSFSVAVSLAIPDGAYGAVRVDSLTERTTAFEAECEGAACGTMAQQQRMARDLLGRANRLLRWYRHLSDDPTVVEVTEAQAGLFVFVAEDGARWGPNQGILTIESAHVTTSIRHEPAELGRLVLVGLGAPEDPPVWHLLLLDARLALAEGRYRECVLHCWSAIESCFGYHYGRWASSVAGLNASERQALVGRDMSLACQMTAGLHLVAGRSLHDLVGEDWAKRRTSYTARNAIVHEGRSATIDDAVASVEFAQSVLTTLERLAHDRRLSGSS